MEPYEIYTCIADSNSEIRRLWNIIGLPNYASLLDIEDGLNNFLLYNNGIVIDSSGALSFRWKSRDGSTIITTPSVFKTWFFIGIKYVDTVTPLARPSTPSDNTFSEHPKIDKDLLEFLLANTEHSE